MSDLLIENVSPEDIKAFGDKVVEFAKRRGDKKFDYFKKFLVKVVESDPDKPTNPLHINVNDPDKVREVFPKLETIFKPLQNVQILSVLNLAMSAANLAATMKGFEEINARLDNIEAQLSEIKKDIDNLHTTNYELQIAKPCRSIVSRYKDISALFQKGKPVSEKDLISLIDDSKEFIISMYNLRTVYSLQVALKTIFMLFPVFANCILMYYQRFYDPNQQKHVRHNEWMEVFDRLSTHHFTDEIQDNMFIDQRKTNKEVNEYLDCQRLIVAGYKQKIDDLLEDLKECGSMEVYDEVMKWSRLYAAQQARGAQMDLEKQIGAERAKEFVEQAMREAALV